MLGDSCVLLHIGEPSSSVYTELYAIIRADELAEMRIKFRSLQPTSNDYFSYQQNVGLAKDSLWALIVPASSGRNRCLLQGTELPIIADLKNSLEMAGIKSPVRVLRDFLKTYPDHLDARLHLLTALREISVERTTNALELDVKVARDEVASLFSNSIFVDTGLLDDKKLSPERDVAIWEPYAQELQSLFASEDWSLVPFLTFPLEQYPAEVCSPIMIQTYRLILPKIEASLEEYPINPHLWLLYGWMASIARQNSATALLDRLTPPPDIQWPREDHWPPLYVTSLLIAEAREKGNWELIAEILIQHWPKYRTQVLLKRMFGADRPFRREVYKGLLDTVWQEYIEPLLESTIKANRVAEAESVLLDIATDKNLNDIIRMAADFALSIGRKDLQPKWLSLQIPEKDKPDIDDFEIRFSINSQSPYLAVINGEKPDIDHIEAMLSQDPLFDWGLRAYLLDTELSESIQQKENWPEGQKHWVLFYKNKICTHGIGLPTEEALINELGSLGLRSPVYVLRRFISEHPYHLAAKESLLEMLRYKVRKKTWELFESGSTAMLADKDDQAIFGDYALLYFQTFPIFVEGGRSRRNEDINSGWNGDFFIHSQLMKNLSISLMPRVEACIRRKPTSVFFWSIWSDMHDLSAGRQYRDLRETLVLSPMDDPLEVPSAIWRRIMMSKYEERSNWHGIIDIQEWRWEMLRESPSRLDEFSWQADISQLLEAYLRLDKSSEANELIRVWSQSPAWQDIRQNAVDLAKKCDKNTLAEQWGKL